MKFDSIEHLYNFKKKQQYPKIHNDIFKLHEYVPVDNVMDMGCCYGLLCHRLSKVYKNVVGIDKSSDYARYFIKGDNIHYYKFKIDKHSMFQLSKIIRKHKIQAVYCRRWIPDLYNQGGFELLHYFKECLYQNNVEYIVLEGRFEFPNSTHKFKDCDSEVAYFEDKYKLIYRWRNCAVLKIKKKSK